MSCWRVLKLSDSADDTRIPQLLIKSQFDQTSYTLFLTDLSNIWSEELYLDGIAERALQQEAPIEVSRQDTSQLDILLQNVQKSLNGEHDTICHITQDRTNGVTLHTRISLPEPLGPLKWIFRLRKQLSAVLKDELILPLLVSSHIQHERVNGLISTIDAKDKAITRLVDQFESSNLDLSSAFPSLGGARTGRKLVKREQAARHVPALQPFHVENWKEETCQLRDSHLSTLGLFQEALSEYTPKVPTELKSEKQENSWWAAIKTKIDDSTMKPKPTPKARKPPAKALSDHGEDETETEDEFEAHPNFKLREAAREPPLVPEAPSSIEKVPQQVGSDESSTDDGDDLDAPLQSRSQSQSQSQRQAGSPLQKLTKPRSPVPEASLLPKAAPSTADKPKGFRIGGAKVKRTSLTPPSEVHGQLASNDIEMSDAPVQSQMQADVDPTSPRAKRTFKIGGKRKAPSQDQLPVNHVGSLPDSEENATRLSRAGSASIYAASPSGVSTARTGTSTLPPKTEEPEETAEEKAERKRRELKRKNEELAKKQSQAKKKKRF